MKKSDYLTEISYIAQCYNDLMPVHIAFISAINNISPPNIWGKFSYCELGCGCGKTVTSVAAAYPNSTCIGIDLNKQHIKIAKKDAQHLNNVEFFAESFSKSLANNFDKFDFIVMHGVWSWVNDEVRADIIRFVKKFLKDDGIFYISYNTMPGWASIMPIRKIIRTYTQNMDCSLQEKATLALEYIAYLQENNAPVFTNNPYANNYISTLMSSDIRYVIHEFFNDTWRPEYFCDVAETMHNNNFRFVGNNNCIMNYLILIPDTLKKILNKATNRITLETHKSILMNEMFRKDLYTTNKNTSKKENNIAQYLQNFLFTATTSINEIQYEIQTNDYKLIFDKKLYTPIFSVLTSSQNTISDINKKIKRSNAEINNTIENIINCICTSQACPVMKNFIPIPTIEQNMKFIISNAHNAYQIETYYEQPSPCIYLASQCAGETYHLSKLNAAILKCICKHGLNEEMVLINLDSIIKHDLAHSNIFGLAVDQDINNIVKTTYDVFCQTTICSLLSLGIIDQTTNQML